MLIVAKPNRLSSPLHAGHLTISGGAKRVMANPSGDAGANHPYINHKVAGKDMGRRHKPHRATAPSPDIGPPGRVLRYYCY